MNFIQTLVVCCSVVFINIKGVSAVEIEQSDIDYVLVGASIGNGWKFNELTARTGIKDKKLEFIGVFDSFDKSPVLNEIYRRKNKPKAVIIKECSVYFPGDTKKYKEMVTKWVSELKANDIEPVLATTVPPGKPEGLVYKIKSFVKGILGKKNKFEEISSYNDWLREYSRTSGYRVLDLEKELRYSDHNRHLNPEYDRGDFTHLNSKAYQKLDNAMVQFLNKK